MHCRTSSIQLTDSCAEYGSMHRNTPTIFLEDSPPTNITPPKIAHRQSQHRSRHPHLRHNRLLPLPRPHAPLQQHQNRLRRRQRRARPHGLQLGVRLIEDFLAKSNTGHCANFRETAEVISKVGFKVFMNVTPTVTGWSQDGKSFGLVFEENPLADFVELPDDGRAQEELWYSNILSGVVRGALEMVCCPSSAVGGDVVSV
jgi:hypothetical protein